MNVSMIVLNPFTHDARVTKEARTLAAHGHRVTVNALWRAGLPYQESIDGYNVQRIRLRSRENQRIPFAAWAELMMKLPSLVQFQKPDVCHAHDLNALIPAYYAAQKTDAKLIYDSHELETGRNRGNRKISHLKKWTWQKIENYLIKKTDAVITVSPSIAQELARLYPVSRPAIVRNCPVLQPLAPLGKLRSWLNIPDETPIILYQGGLSKGRGLEIFMEALSQIPDAAFVILGDGVLRSDLQKLSTKLDIEHRLYMPGKVPWRELLYYTRDADIGLSLIENVCLSYYFSLPNKLFEYQMAGVPVLASNFPDMKQIVTEWRSGCVADSANVADIVTILRQMLADPDELKMMGERARQAAIERYNWEIESKTLLKVYTNLQ